VANTAPTGKRRRYPV